jgi:hypothetical protein
MRPSKARRAINRKQLLALQRLDPGRQTRLGPGGGVAVDDAFGGGFIQQLGRLAQFGLGLLGVPAFDRFENLFALGVDGLFGRSVAVAADAALFQSFLGALDIRHGIRWLGGFFVVRGFDIRFGLCHGGAVAITGFRILA